MKKKEIEKKYLEKANQLKKYNKTYFELDNPTISDAEYDVLKKEILNVGGFLLRDKYEVVAGQK